MNDYLIPRFSKNDVREFWLALLEHKKKLQEEAEKTCSEQEKASYTKALASISFCMNELEKTFDLF